MRRKFIIAGFLILSGLLVIQGTFNTATSNVGGAAAGYTGSPADGASCTSCHSPQRNFSGVGVISSDIPASGYTANQTYTVTASVTRKGHTVFGFEVSPQDTTPAGNLMGTITITSPTTTQLASHIQGYITHTQNGTKGTNNADSWTFNWTAPATGLGPVVFYGAFNVSNGNNQDNGDSIYLTSLKVYECVAPADLPSITGNASLCSGISSVYSVPAGSTGTTFNWTLPSGWTGTSTNNSITVIPGSTGGTISASAVNSCGTSNTVSKIITVTNSVTAGISITPSQNNICAGTQVSFSATTGNAGNTPTYQWLVNGAHAGTDSSGFTSSALTNGSVVSCILTSSLACVLNSPDTSTSLTMVVNPTVTPSVSISASALNICADSTVSYTASPVQGGTGPGYQWYKNGGLINGATASNYSPATFADKDIYTVHMTSNAACPSPKVVISNADTLHVTAVVVPSVTISANPGNTICQNQGVTFSSTPINPGNSAVYQWQKNGTDVLNANSSSFTSDSLKNGDVITLRMTSSAACSSPQSVTSSPITMVVTSVNPTVTISSNSGSSICAAQQVVFSSGITGGGNNPIYQWKQNGFNIDSATEPTYTTDSLVDGESISLELTSDAACASPQQVQSNTIPITVVSNASPSVSISSAFGDSICAGQTGTLTAVQLNGGNAPVFQWYDNGDSIIGAVYASYTPVSITNNDSITVELVSNSSCVSSATAFSESFVATVIPTVTPHITVTLQGSDSICAGQEVAFTAAAQNGGTNPLFQWLDNGATIPDANDSLFSSIALSDSSAISIMLTSDLACASPPTVTSNSILIRVAQPVQPAINFVLNTGDTICPGQSVTFTSSENNGGSNPQFQWIRNDTALSGITSANYTSDSINNGDAISVQLTSNAVCAVQNTVISEADTFTVPAVVQSSVTISTTSDSVCPGTTVLFNANIQSEGGSYSSPAFYWKKNGVLTGNNTSLFVDTNALNGEIISCQCTSNAACLSAITSNDITLTVFPTSVPVVTSQGDTLISTPASAYQWFYNGQVISTATNPVLPTDSAGIYTVQTTDINGCQNLSDTFNFVPAGIDQLSNEGQLNVYPNPTEGVLQIDLVNKSTAGNLRFTVYNVNGEIMHQQLLVAPAPQTKFQLDLSGLANGIYLLQINNKQLNAYRKFVISN